MRIIKTIFERVAPYFDEGAVLRPMKPLYDAMDNFFFGPDLRTKTGPHIRDPLDVKRYMSMVIIALLPCVFAAIYFFGLRVIPMIIVSYAAGGAVEVFFAVVRKDEINEGFLVTGLLFPMVLPPGLPLWMVAVGVIFGVLIGKELFGGTGRNLFNPALVGRCFLALAYPKAMSGSWISPVAAWPGRLLDYATAADVDAVTGATPLGMAKQGEWAGLGDLFLGNISGSLGETFALGAIVGGVFLLLTRVSSWRTVVGILGSFIVLATALHWADPQQFGPPLWHVMAGGLLLGAFFMATDPVSSPNTNGGKWAYGILIGSLAVLIRNFTGYVEGVMFSILLGNITAPILDEIAIRIRLRRLQSER